MTDGNGQPAGWSEAPISELTEVNPSRIQPSCASDALVNFVPMASVAEEFGGIDLSLKRPLREVQKGYTQFRESDVIVAKITPCMENGKLAVVPPLDSEVGYGSTEFHVLRPRNGVLSDWIAYFVSQSSFRRVAQRNMAGSAGQLRVPVSWLEEQVVPIAPPNEQSRITEKIEELFSDLDAGVVALERARANLKRYRAAVLKAAVEGKLTEQWRKAHPKVEPASKLLERILAERRRKWEKAQLVKFAAAGKAPPKGWKDKYPEPTKSDTANLAALPERWCWASVDQLSVVVRGASPRPAGDPKYFGGNDVPWITVGSLTADDSTYLHSVSEFLTFAGKEWSRFIEADTLLLTNSGATLGVPKITMLGGCINDGSVALLDVEYPLKLYLVYFFHTQTKRLRGINQGAAQPNLNTTIVKSIMIPLPPRNEQELINKEIEYRLSIQREVEQQIDAEISRATRLRQSILKRAFEGKLVPQDPTDEPASILLERICNARAAKPAKDKRNQQGR